MQQQNLFFSLCQDCLALHPLNQVTCRCGGDTCYCDDCQITINKLLEGCLDWKELKINKYIEYWDPFIGIGSKGIKKVQNKYSFNLLGVNYYIKLHLDEMWEIEYITVTSMDPNTMKVNKPKTFFDLSDFKTMFVFGEIEALWFKDYQSRRIEEDKKKRIFKEIEEAVETLKCFIEDSRKIFC